MRRLVFGVSLMLFGATHASAQVLNPEVSLFSSRAVHAPWQRSWLSCRDEVAPAARGLALRIPPPLLEQDDGQPLHATAVEHSDAYETRKKIHKLASFATLPLFAAEVVLGQSLYNNSANAGGKRTAHGIVGAGIVGLFAVNTITGAWNLFGEDRKDPKGRTLRLVHGLLMMAADVGFVATSRSGPNSRSPRQALTFETSKVTHRNLAMVSIGIGTAGYLVMLLGNH